MAEKMVKIKLPYIPGGDKLLYVSVNDRNMLVPRGREVEVPACFAEVIRNSEQQQLEAEERRAKLQADANF